MSQSLKHSALEALTQVVGGLILSTVSYLWVLPLLFGITLSIQMSTQLTLYFALAAWLKSLGIRRLWNAYVRRKVQHVPQRVGSIQSLPRAGTMSEMQYHRHQDTTHRDSLYESEGPNGHGIKVNEPALTKEDKELR